LAKSISISHQYEVFDIIWQLILLIQHNNMILIAIRAEFAINRGEDGCWRRVANRPDGLPTQAGALLR
jgi:hypothetical protein